VDASGWPAVPPPPMPAPLVVEGDPTMRIARPQADAVPADEPTRVMPAPGAEPPTR
jgi:hypothetical protein